MVFSMSITPWQSSSAFTYVHERTMGFSNSFISQYNANITRSMAPSTDQYLLLKKCSIYCMDMDPIYDQYLLIGTSKSQILLHDVDKIHSAPHLSDKSSPSLVHSFHNSIQRHRSQPIRYGIPSLCWYPVDAGLFISTCSNQENCINVWDTNEYSLIQSFRLQSKVHTCKFSRCATLHSLIAASLENGEIRLCDMQTQTSTHTLFGHRDPVWSLVWSPSNEFSLASACTRGEIRLWDIRRSGTTACLYCLNQDGGSIVPSRATSWEDSGCVKRPKNSKAREPTIAASYAPVRAHNGSILSLCYTPNGRFLLSSGTDQALRLWHAGNGRHTFVHFQGVRCSARKKSFQMECVQESDEYMSTLLFYPNGDSGELACYPVHWNEEERVYARGKAMNFLGVPLAEGTAACMRSTAHYAAISSCVYRKSYMELYTGGEDGMVMRWRPMEKREEDVYSHEVWSEEEEEEEEGFDAVNAFVPPILR